MTPRWWWVTFAVLALTAGALGLLIEGYHAGVIVGFMCGWFLALTDRSAA